MEELSSPKTAQTPTPENVKSSPLIARAVSLSIEAPLERVAFSGSGLA